MWVFLVTEVLFFGGLFATYGNISDIRATTTVSEVSQCVVPYAEDGRECETSDPLTPAKLAGLENGDRIVGFNGTSVDSWEGLQTLIRGNSDGAAEITFVRDGVTMTAQTNTTVQARPNSLEDETLKARVTALMQRCGFTAKGFFVMDGSRRSAHANAYFTGFGASKRVVFFDTLLRQLAPAEVEAVLAHELGHFHHRHIAKRMAAMFLLSLAGFALLGWLSGAPWFYAGLGVQPNLSSLVPGVANAPSDALALLLFALAVPVFTVFLSPLFAQLSRRHEFEADAYAARQTHGADLASALLKLYEDNASTLTPDPLYVKFYYSHPPATERLARMQAGAPA